MQLNFKNKMDGKSIVFETGKRNIEFSLHLIQVILHYDDIRLKTLRKINQDKETFA